MRRRLKLAAAGATGLALLALIVILVNVLANWVFVRFDVTRNKAYSLSSSSRRLVRELEDPLIVKVFFTPDLPSPYNTVERYVRDILTEYRSAGRGKVRYEFVPTQPAPAFEQKAAEAGLAPLQFEQSGTDQLQIRRGYMGLILYHRDKSEVLPVIKDPQTLEYDLTSRIAKMARKSKKVIALSSGHRELQWQDPKSPLGQDLAQLYDLRQIAISSTTAPLQADMLLVVGPQRPLEDTTLFWIDQAIMRGIPAAFLVDTHNFIPGQFMAIPVQSGLPELLKTYGAKVDKRLIYDAQCQTIGVTQNVGGLAFQTSIRYPYIPLSNRLANDHPIFRGVESMAVPFVVPVDPEPGSGIHFKPLVFTSPKSWQAPENTASVTPNNIPQPGKDDPHGPYIVGAILEGTFTSHFKGKPSPIAGQSVVEQSPKNQIFVLGTAQLLNPELPPFVGADAMLSNVMATLSKDDILIGIRSKGDILRPLKPISARVRDLSKVLAVLLPSLLAVAVGLWRWRRRQAWRDAIRATLPPRPAPQA